MSHFKTSDGLSLYYEDAGDGLPVLCLAGLTRTTRDFDYVAPYLNGVRMIRLDYRGRGHSDHDPDWKNYTPPVECRDVFELLSHLGLSQVAILGTSRGGLNAMGIAATAPQVLLGVALNDIGPVIDRAGLDAVADTVGRNPTSKTHEDAAAAIEVFMSNFTNVPKERWLEEARLHFRATEDGLKITYDAALRDSVLAAMEGPDPDLWPFFDAFPDRPLALIWGKNSDLLSASTVAEMQRRRPDMILGAVPDRGHIPFLDEPESIAALTQWIEAMQ